MRTVKLTFIAFVLFTSLYQCKKSGKDIENPYSKVVDKPKQTDTSNKNAAAYSIEGLHRDLFKPTCSNSGCHDGTFEPDFRTVQSTYSTLVNQKPIKNDLAGTFSARVLPGNADGSILVYRMTEDLGGNSGIMPLVLDPGSDYESKKNTHISNIKKWINDGALDFLGNKPNPVDYPPNVLGVQVLVSNNAASRGGKYEPVYVAAGNNFEIWFSLSDDKLNQKDLTAMTINWSTDPSNYDTNNEKALALGTPKFMAGLYAASAEYAWYYSFTGTGLKKDDVIWFRITMNDGKNNGYQLPNENSMFFLKKYFAVKIQ
ncbi:MAG: hypothetical protein ACOVQJ_02200 [Bacteroidia bacterium]|jgi:hypothetical protein